MARPNLARVKIGPSGSHPIGAELPDSLDQATAAQIAHATLLHAAERRARGVQTKWVRPARGVTEITVLETDHRRCRIAVVRARSRAATSSTPNILRPTGRPRYDIDLTRVHQKADERGAPPFADAIEKPCRRAATSRGWRSGGAQGRLKGSRSAGGHVTTWSTATRSSGARLDRRGGLRVTATISKLNLNPSANVATLERGWSSSMSRLWATRSRRAATSGDQPRSFMASGAAAEPAKPPSAMRGQRLSGSSHAGCRRDWYAERHPYDL